MLPSYSPKNPHALVWPTPRGAQRQKGKVYGFREHLAAAGIKRRVRWHDLRHTCGSSLIAGWWGKAWALAAVRDLLGHSSVTQTERYAHLALSVVSEAAAETFGQQFGKHPDPVRMRIQREPSSPRRSEAEGGRK